MKKLLSIVTLLMFGIAQTAFAGGAMMTDSEMEGVSAGDWVINDGANGPEVVDVYFNNNDIQLLNESQTELKAVNNANTVDSAIAVQTNIARVSSANAPTNNVGVNGSNTADITNLNPQAYEKTTEVNSETKTHKESSLKTTSDTTQESSSSALSSGSSSGSSCSVNINYNDNEACAGTEQSMEKGAIGQGSFSGSKIETLVAVLTETSSSSSEETATETSSASGTAITAEETSSECSVATLSEKTSEKRDSKSENNHLTLLNTSQKNLMAVSNVNSVGSGAAVQTNIASNVGVSGTITHANSAKVVNGL